MAAYKIVNEIDRDTWSEFVRKHRNGNIFQSPEMFELFKNTDNYKPLLLAIRGKEGEIAGLLSAVIQEEPGLLRYFSSRCILWGGPLIDPTAGESGEVLLELLLRELARQVSRKAIYIQIRNMFDISLYAGIFQKNGFRFHNHLNYIVETRTREKTEKKISKSKMRQVRKSLKSGARIVEPQNIGEVEAFYNILKDLYKTKIKRPLPGWSFFESFYGMNQNNNKNFGTYLLIEYKEKIIGGIMCPITPGRTIYELYVCGLDDKYKNKGLYPSVLATWAAMDYALKKGLKKFDFMGAGKPDQDYGVREFKAKFGGNLVEYGRFERINNKPLYLLGKIGLKVLGAFKG
jgi:lipid II:glycine glycyltransferase (peptidoglycan interpeptide bridge formation enzyme)